MPFPFGSGAKLNTERSAGLLMSDPGEPEAGQVELVHSDMPGIRTLWWRETELRGQAVFFSPSVLERTDEFARLRRTQHAGFFWLFNEMMKAIKVSVVLQPAATRKRPVCGGFASSLFQLTLLYVRHRVGMGGGGPSGTFRGSDAGGMGSDRLQVTGVKRETLAN